MPVRPAARSLILDLLATLRRSTMPVGALVEETRLLRMGSRRRRAELEPGESRLATLPIEAAMVEAFLLGRAVIRELVLDPLLPDAICPSADRQALAAALRRYDRLGRAAWAGFLTRFDVPHIGTPLDSPLGVEAERRAV